MKKDANGKVINSRMLTIDKVPDDIMRAIDAKVAKAKAGGASSSRRNVCINLLRSSLGLGIDAVDV